MSFEARNKYNLKFFFHAGETDWFGSPSDTNVLDAVLLNATRIGHGYSLVKHPILKQMIKEQEIAVEVCPISNQVLGLVNDLRNHPAVLMIQESYPLVIASDDFGSWEAHALSDDFYEVLMAMSGREADLKLLKQLALNSIKYSWIGEEKKAVCSQIWSNKWKTYMREFLPMTDKFKALLEAF